ncbi:golgin subfamily A member 5-like [Anoplophora glabripennis]|uniref:golgin subfamily A member 5-like n=1 Tax=Anoplophora glabripennis TaxID=217634 RepID=UPI0008752D91|nr:golgin subfamily A member 5-like [Anoplophora glabripennis]
MACKVFLVTGAMLLVAVVQIRSLQAEEETRKLSLESRNKADDLLKKLKEEVDRAMAKAHKALDDAKKKVNEAADKVQAEAKRQMQSTLDKLKEELETLKEKAKKAGVNIDDCLKGNEDRLVNLPNQLSNDMVHCVSDQINKAISFAQDALDHLQKIVDEVENIKQEIKDCGHGFHAVKCIAKLAVRIEKDITTLPTRIEADVTATVALISNLDKEVKKCASNKVDQCENDGKKILEVIAACVAKKIITH